MTGDGDVVPVGVVERALDEPLVQVTLGDVGAPRAREVARAGLRAQVGFFAAFARCGVAPGWVASAAGGDVGGGGGGGGGGAPLEVESPACRPSSFSIARCSQRFTQSLPLKNTLAPCSTRPRPQNTVAHRKSQPIATRKIALSTTKKNVVHVEALLRLDPPLRLLVLLVLLVGHAALLSAWLRGRSA